MEWFLALAGTFWLGIQTSICPCPLATNIAAISYIGRRVNGPRETIFSASAYACGQMFAYIALSSVVLGIPFCSGDRLTRFFTSTLHVSLGPILILIGLILTRLIDFPLPGIDGERMKKWVDRLGIWSAFPLGILLAVAFCPTTAAMFLAMLAVSAKVGSVLLFPLAFGIGASLPVVFFAILLAFHVQWLGKMLRIAEKMDRWMSKLAGVAFIVIGVLLTLRNPFGLF